MMKWKIEMGFMSNPAAGGDFTVYLKYNAKAGRWYTKDDKPEAQEFEVTDMTAVFDIDNLRTGWFLFAPGVAPVKQFDPSLSEPRPSPGEGFKKGFELNLFSEKNLMGVREFSSTAGAVIEEMNALYDAWEAQRASHPGKLPVVKCQGVQPVVGKHGTNYRPVLEIVGWTDRPAALPGGTATASPAPAAAPPPSAPAAHAPPPPLAAPAAASAGEPVF
jgi:hypothetical protein